MVKNRESKTSRARKWGDAYREWQESGLAQRDYCSRAGYGFWQFKAGIEEARRARIVSRRRKPSSSTNQGGSLVAEQHSGFAPVQILEARSQAESPYCEIRFRGAVGIRIETAESLREFINLIKAGTSR